MIRSSLGSLSLPAAAKWGHEAGPSALTTQKDQWQQQRLDWEAQGVRFNAFFNRQFGSVLKGGVETSGSGRASASLDAFLTLDLGRLRGPSQAEVLLHLQSNWGGGINPRTGGLLQVFDDADGSIGGHVAQFWYRQHDVRRRMSLQLGYLDFQTIVDRNEFAGSEDKQFMHQALDNNPTIPLRIGLGAAWTAQFNDWYTLVLGVADGQAVPYKGGISRAFHEQAWYTVYAESQFRVRLSSRQRTLPGHYRMGCFYDPGPRPRFPRYDGQRSARAGHFGAYVSLDQVLFRERVDDLQGLGVFARFGYRDPEVHRMSEFWSGGLSYTGLFPGRDQDVLGLGYATLRASPVFRDRVDRSLESESVYELYYAMRINPSLVVTPDLQYIDNPACDGTVGHAVVAGVRVRYAF